MGRSPRWFLPIFGSCALACGTKWHILLTCRAFQSFTQRLQTKKKAVTACYCNDLKYGAGGEQIVNISIYFY